MARLRAAISLAPGSAEPYYWLALVCLQHRRLDEALAAIGQARRATPSSLARGLEAAILAAHGKRDQARAIARDLRASSAWVDPIIFSRIYLELGDTEKSLEYLGRSIDERSPLPLYARIDPLYARVRTHRRFRELIAQLHLPAAQSAAVT